MKYGNTQMYESQFLKAPPSAEWIKSQYSLLSTIFQERNGEYQVLRRVMDGDFASAQEARQKVGTPFQDRMKLIYNIGNATVRRYMDSMSAPPRIEVKPSGFEMEDLEIADKGTKFLEYVYGCNNFGVKLMHVAFYQSLLDKAILHVRPAPHLPHKIRIEVGVPDFYYPITRGDDYLHPVGVLYGFRTYKGNDFLRDPMRFKDNRDEFETNIEYWDATHFVRLQGDKIIYIKHDLGEIPWFEVHNIPIPHRFRGQGDVDQSVGLNEYLNMLMSAMGDMIAYAAAPIAVVRGTKMGGTNLPFEPRAVWELERDAQVGFLQWSGTPPAVEAQMLRTIQAIEDMTGVSSPAFGREIPSGVSGSAVRSLLAGFNTRLGTKQQMLGDAMVKMNKCILRMAETMFPDEEFRVVGENIIPGKELGKRKVYTVKPKEFGGWYENKVIFQPLDPAATYFQEIDKFSKGIQSRFTTMKNIGVQNVWDELQRIKIEKMEEAEHENNLGLAKNGQFVSPDKQAADQAEMDDFLKQLQGGNVPGIAPDGVQDKQGKRDLASQVQQQSSTGVVPGSPTLEAPVKEEPFDPSPILAKLKQATNLTGKAALMGTKILLENVADENAVRQALGDDARNLKFEKLDPDKPLSGEAIPFYQPIQGQKKNQVEIRDLEKAYLSVVVLDEERTNNASTYVIGLRDEKGSIVRVGKTDPVRGARPERGELIRVSVGSLSRRDDGGVVRWGLGKVSPVKASQIPAKPSSYADVARLFEGGKPR